MLRAGIRPKPKINSGETGMRNSTPIQMTPAGNSARPAQAPALAKPFMSQMKMFPANTGFE